MARRRSSIDLSKTGGRSGPSGASAASSTKSSAINLAKKRKPPLNGQHEPVQDFSAGAERFPFFQSAPQDRQPALHQIKASAGSGKTYQLTTNFIKALAETRARDERGMAAAAAGILAITFTNAAANEMRERVIQHLKKIVLGLHGQKDSGLTPSRAAAWLELFLADSSALNIRTIDSLLHQIVRASSLSLRIHPDYETQFDLREAIRPVLQKHLALAARDGPQREMLRKACELVIDVSKAGFGHGKVVIGKIEDLLELVLQGAYDNMANLEACVGIQEKLVEALKKSAGALVDLADGQGLKWAPRKKPAAQKYAAGEFGKSPGKIITDRDATLLFIAGELPASIHKAYAEFCLAADKYHVFQVAVGQATSLTPLIAFAKAVVADFLARQREDGILPQMLISRYARQALNGIDGVSDALCRLGSRLMDALIDEFQDTSQDQWAAVKPLAVDALSRGGALTWVGDVKQSIYGWRGGDSNLFDVLCIDRDLTRIVPEPKKDILTVNRRSRREIVEHNNRFFAPLANTEHARSVLAAVMPDAPAEILLELACLLAANYQDVEQQSWAEKGDGGYVSLQFIEGEKKADILRGAAARLLETLQTKIQGRRPWSDVLVLVRSGEEAKIAVECLSDAGIEVVTENGLLLAKNSLVMEIAAFLRFLNNPRDDVSLWIVLQGDIFATHKDAQDLLMADPSIWLSGEPRSPLYERLLNHFPEIWEALIAPFYANAGLLTAYDTIHEYYFRMDVERRFPRHATMLRRFLEMAYQLESAGISSLSGFLQYWDEHGEEEKAPMPGQMDAVRIMTIHKAKGLQAPVVMVFSTMFGVSPSRLPVLEEFEGHLLPVKAVKAIGEPYFRNVGKQALEAMNLLYVAITRAEEELYIFHPVYQGGKSKYLSYAVNELLRISDSFYEYEVGRLPEKPENHKSVEGTGDTGESGDFTPGVFPPDWRPMSWLPRVRIFRNQVNAPELTANERGVLAHAALERVNFDFPPAEAAEIALKMATSALGMSITQAERDALLAALAWYAGLPQARRWREAGFAEHSFLLANGKLLRPDLIVPLASGCLVIDYKTGQPHDAHVAQVRQYMECIGQSGQFAGPYSACLVYLDLRRFRVVAATTAGDLTESIPDCF